MLAWANQVVVPTVPLALGEPKKTVPEAPSFRYRSRSHPEHSSIGLAGAPGV
jgi:hypothetical protein